MKIKSPREQYIYLYAVRYSTSRIRVFTVGNMYNVTIRKGPLKNAMENNLEKPAYVYKHKMSPDIRAFKVEWSYTTHGDDTVRLTSKVALPESFGAKTDNIETHRIFRFSKSARTREDELQYQLGLANKDLQDKLNFIWQANHGMLDSAMGTIRFNA